MKPCISCDGKAEMGYKSEVEINSYYVECGRCRMRGPRGITMEGAVTAWEDLMGCFDGITSDTVVRCSGCGSQLYTDYEVVTDVLHVDFCQSCGDEEYDRGLEDGEKDQEHN